VAEASLTGALPAQQVLGGGANLFAVSRQAGKKMDAARALSLAPFYSTEGLKTDIAPGTLVRSEPANDFAQPPHVSATRFLDHTRTAGNEDCGWLCRRTSAEQLSRAITFRARWTNTVVVFEIPDAMP